MEHKGLVKVLKFLADNSVQVETPITDRHKQIARYMREQKPSIDHRYDVWHVSKGIHVHISIYFVYSCNCNIGIKKKLCRLSNTSKCTIIAEWIKSITNHLYWCAASAPDGNGDDMVKRWKSLINHICDIHEDCYHLELGDQRVKYISAGNALLYAC